MSYTTIELTREQVTPLATTLIKTESQKFRQLEDGTIVVIALAAIYSIDKWGNIGFRWEDDNA